jgi:hypothetical protein
MLSDRERVLVIVWDASPFPPSRLHPGEDAEEGRGLVLVETLSAEWGWHPAPWGNIEGKATWALMTVT